MLPSGIVTFLFTDIEGSTPLFQHDPEAMALALFRHNQIVSEAIAGHNGRVFQVIGDAFCAAFSVAADAVQAALAAQRALHAQDWGKLGRLRVRIGLHTGVAEPSGDAYSSSLTLVRVQRIMSAGHGEQVLMSAATAQAVGAQLPPAVTLRDLGPHKLRGLTQPEEIYQLIAPDLPSEFPRLRAVEQNADDTTALIDQLVRGTFVGRRSELDQLNQHWELARQARGHLVLLSGEPGIGKTRLAQELFERARREGAVVLHGGCYEFEATTPYLPFVEALREWVHWESPEQLRTLLGATAPEILKFAPEVETKLGPIPQNPALAPNEERLRLFDNIARLLQSLAAPRGLLIFLDDLHWADQSSLALLHYILRHLRTSRVMVLAAYRELELDRSHPLAAALVEWNREKMATRIPLGRLTHSDTAALIAGLFGESTISDEFVTLLFNETEGNPFFLEEVIKALIEQGSIYREGDRWGRKELNELAVPQSVKEAIGRRLNRLDETTIQVLHTAAALGKSFPFRELAAVSTSPEEVLLDALDSASAAQLLRANADDSFAFTHDKIREVLYEELNPIRRRRLHQRIGESFVRLYGESGNGHVQDIAYHFAQSGDLERSLTYARRASESAARVFAYDEALRFLEQAREAAEALNLPSVQAAIDAQRGDMYRYQGMMREAIGSYEHALKHSESQDVRGILHSKLGETFASVGDPQGPTHLEQALQSLDPVTQNSAYALSLAGLGRYKHYRGEPAEAIRLLDQARELAEPYDDPKTLELIYSYLAGAYQHIVDFDTSNEWARSSIALGERHNEPAAIAVGYEFLSENATGRGDWPEALKYAALNRKLGEKIGALDRIAWSTYAGSLAYYGQGDLAAARAAVLEGIDVCEQIGESRLATWLDPQAALIFTEQGDDDAAQAHAQRGLERAEQLGQVVLTCWALNGMGYWRLRRGEADLARPYYERFLELIAVTENKVARIFVLANAAEALFRSGEIERASRVVQEAIEVALLAKSSYFWCRAKRVEGYILNSHGESSQAEEVYNTVIETTTAQGSRLEAARTLAARAESFQARGNLERAADDRERARALFIACGAAIRL